MVFNIENQADGSELVTLEGDPVPFARVLPPRLTGSKKWGVQYRDPQAPHFDGYPNAHPKNRDDVLYELRKYCRVTTPYQRGVIETTQSH